MMPNKLDFDVVYTEIKRLDQTGNIIVLSAIIVVLLLYFLAVIFARKADKRDILKVLQTSSYVVKAGYPQRFTALALTLNY